MTAQPTTQPSTPKPYRDHSTESLLSPVERGVMGVLGLGALALSLRGGPVERLLLAAVGVGFTGMAATGTNPLATALKIRQNEEGDTLVSDAVTVGQPPERLYAIWRDLTNLPGLMKHLESVQVLDERRSRWTVKGPAGTAVSWDAELTADEPGRRIAWRSLPGAAIENSGEVLFRPAPGDRGTEIRVNLAYHAPGGTTGAVIARIAGQEPSQQLRDDLMRFKREQELGFAPTTKGQSSGRAEKDPGQAQQQTGQGGQK
ncbi:SRPBCC family protein [Deinococcus phoenicis]|nr:SRPBCC family protein [Deinococcus phoenicis]